MIDMICQVVVGFMGIVAITLVITKNRWGSVVGLASQPFWIITAYIHNQMGVLFVSTVYAFVWIYGIRQAFFKNEHTLMVAVSYVIIRNGTKILLMMRQNTGFFDGMYSLPSGHMEDGELPIDTAIRETGEEVGIYYLRDELKLVHVSSRPKHDHTGPRVDFFYSADLHGEPENMEPDKCGGIEWFDINELPVNLVPVVRHALTCAQNEIPYSELGKDFLVQEGMWKL